MCVVYMYLRHSLCTCIVHFCDCVREWMNEEQSGDHIDSSCVQSNQQQQHAFMPFVVLSLHVSFFFTFECGETTATTVIFDRHARHTHTHSVRTIFIPPNDMLRDQMLALYTRMHTHTLAQTATQCRFNFYFDYMMMLTIFSYANSSHRFVYTHCVHCAWVGLCCRDRERQREGDVYCIMCKLKFVFVFMFFVHFCWCRRFNNVASRQKILKLFDVF